MSFFLSAALCFAASPQDMVGKHPYTSQETREDTRSHMMDLVSPQVVRWGNWYQCSPFPFVGHGEGDLATEHPPERELFNMGRGTGPDLDAVYPGKDGSQASWVPLGPMAGLRINLDRHEGDTLHDLVAGYLYTTIEAKSDSKVEYTMGSDDGCRFWLNGELILDKDVPRGLDATEDTIQLKLKQGTNHVLIEVVDGYGGWEYQILTHKPMSAKTEAELNYLLDRDFPKHPMRAHYTALTIPIPDDLVIEVGGLTVMPDGRPALATRRGDVYFVENAYEEPPLATRWNQFASGLHEPLGLEWRDEDGVQALYSVQRGELTRMVDEDGDGRADKYEAFNNDWGVSGNYHEFAFGPKFDDEGNAWVTLNVGFCGSLGKATVPYRGWAVKITPQGEMIPVCSGLRSPNGIGKWKDGSMFYVDNQGDYVATNRLSYLKQDSYIGHPAGLRWREDADTVKDAPPERQPASIWFPYKTMGHSTADLVLDTTGGKFGPFTEQFFAGDQMMATVMRVDLEIVNGHYQGACYPFIERLDSGVNRMAFAPDGSMFVGQTDRGWGSIGKRSYGLQRLVWNGKTPFEILHMRALEDGFELEFTADIDEESAARAASYSFESYTYEYLSDYGAPEIDRESVAVSSVKITGPRTVQLKLEKMRAGYVHALDATGLHSRKGAPLVHSRAWYTLIEVPGQDKRQAAAKAPVNKKPRLLFLTHSAGFCHSVVKRKTPDTLSFAEATFLREASDQYEIVATQDCSTLEADSLATFDVVMFYTTGDLPVSDAVRTGFLNWVKAGGAFVGIHCATDTWMNKPDFVEFVGGTFNGHPWHEPVTLLVEDREHPSTQHLDSTWEITDEIYQFGNWKRGSQHNLLKMTEAKSGLAKGARADGDYVNAWCKSYGEGRLFYTALGHREEVWENPDFMQHLLGGIEWTLAE